jgi:hypothetical protein
VGGVARLGKGKGKGTGTGTGKDRDTVGAGAAAALSSSASVISVSDSVAAVDAMMAAELEGPHHTFLPRVGNYRRAEQTVDKGYTTSGWSKAEREAMNRCRRARLTTLTCLIRLIRRMTPLGASYHHNHRHHKRCPLTYPRVSTPHHPYTRVYHTPHAEPLPTHHPTHHTPRRIYWELDRPRAAANLLGPWRAYYEDFATRFVVLFPKRNVEEVAAKVQGMIAARAFKERGEDMFWAAQKEGRESVQKKRGTNMSMSSRFGDTNPS